MVKRDLAADRKRAQRQRKAEKRELRDAWRTEGIASAVRLFLTTPPRQTEASEECTHCQALKAS